MRYKEKLEMLINKNDGFISAKEARLAGIPRQYFIVLQNEDKIHRVSRGLYLSNDVFDDNMYCIQKRSSNIIFSHETALYLHDLTDRDPLFYTITVPQGYDPRRLKNSGIEVHSIKKELFELGKTTAKTVYGREVVTYDLEKTICDILRNRNNMDKYTFKDAMQRYVVSKKRNIPLLIEYANKLGIYKILNKYLEVLL